MLKQYGQSVWLNFLGRGMIRHGQLKRLMEEYGIAGAAANLEIGDRVTGGRSDYEDVFDELARIDFPINAQAIYERISIVDARMAADTLRPVFDQSHGGDGFASIAVSPYLAHDAQASVNAARRLWDRVHRPNLMIAVPATPESLTVIETLTAEGINVNVMLIFSPTQYDSVVAAYLRGIESAPDPAQTASVASVSVNRIDTAMDGELLRIGTPQALALRGKIGIAIARRIYSRFCGIFHSARFAGLRLRRVQPQRMLWTSPTAEDHAGSDFHYVEELIGPDTITAVSPATLDAFREHGQVCGITLHRNLAEAEAVIENLQSVGIDFDSVAQRLQADGVSAFAASLGRLLTMLDGRRDATAKS